MSRAKRDLTSRIMAAETAETARITLAEETSPFGVSATRRAEIARDEIAAWLEEFADSLEEACHTLRHAGQRGKTASRQGVSCPRCRVKVAHFREAAGFVGTGVDRRASGENPS